MSSFRRTIKKLSTLLVAVFVGVITLGVPTQAHADFKLRYSLNGGSTWTEVDGTSQTIDGVTYWDASVTIGSVNLKANGSSALSVPHSTLDLAVNGIAAKNTTFDLVVQATVTGVETAPPPQTLTYDFTGGIGTNNIGTLTATQRTFVDADNNFYGEGGTIVADTGNLPTGSSGTIIFDTNPTYSWTAETRLTGKTGNGPGTGPGVSLDNLSEIAAAPAPAGFVLAVTGMATLGLGAFVRRRRGTPSAPTL